MEKREKKRRTEERNMVTYVVKREFVRDDSPQRIVEKMVKNHMQN